MSSLMSSKTNEIQTSTDSQRQTAPVAQFPNPAIMQRSTPTPNTQGLFITRNAYLAALPHTPFLKDRQPPAPSPVYRHASQQAASPKRRRADTELAAPNRPAASSSGCTCKKKKKKQSAFASSPQKSAEVTGRGHNSLLRRVVARLKIPCFESAESQSVPADSALALRLKGLFVHGG